MNSKQAFAEKLKHHGLNIKLGPFSFNIKSSIPNIIDEIHTNYQHHELLNDNSFIDFYVSVNKAHNIRRWIRPQVDFYVDGHKPFKPLPINQAYPMLEWGMNWCIANYGHYFLIIHAGVIAKDDKAIVFPAPQGSGKSTLTAALANSGWRLLSDELAIISLQDGRVYPCTRPISLKNESINIISTRFPKARLMPPVADTTKGTVSLMKPDNNSVTNDSIPANIAAVVFPKYHLAGKGRFEQKEKSQTLIELIQNSFNYHVISKQGFDMAASIVDSASCYDYVYSDLTKAIDDFDALLK